jgi:hypothetical protein
MSKDARNPRVRKPRGAKGLREEHERTGQGLRVRRLRLPCLGPETIYHLNKVKPPAIVRC